MSSNEFPFTKPKIDALSPAPKGQRLEYSDTKVPGLRLRVTESGAKTYSVYARLKGSGPERVTIGSADKLTPELARIEAKKIMADLAQGITRKASATRTREATLAVLVQDYYSSVTMRPRSLAAYKWLFEKYIEKDLGGKKVADITVDHIRKLHTKVTKDAPTTANRCVGLIKAAYNWAAKEGRFDGQNPAQNVRKNVEASRERYLQPAELAKFFAALEQCEDPAKSFFTLALLTGARRSNVLAMRWADISLDDGLWNIPAADAKAGEPLRIPLVPEAAAVLRRIRCDADKVEKRTKVSSPWVFPAESKTGHYQEPKRAWATLRRRSGLTDLRIHDLRRTMGSWLVRTGASTAVNAKALGHKSMQAAAVYQRIADTDPVREAMERATAAFLSVPDSK